MHAFQPPGAHLRTLDIGGQEAQADRVGIEGELHHIYPRGQGGDDQIENLSPVCSPCHRKIEARDPVARSLLRGALMPTNLAYLHDKLGERTAGWLERHYPPTLFRCQDPEAAWIEMLREDVA